MAAPSVRSVGTFASGTTSCTPGLPSGWQQNDFFVLIAECDDSETPNNPSGYTFVDSGNDATDVKLSVWVRRATASESAPTVDGTSNHVHAVMAAVQGADTAGSPYALGGFTDNSGVGAGGVFAGMTTSVDDALVLMLSAIGDNANDAENLSAYANSNLTSVTEHFDQAETTGTGGGLGIASGVKASAGGTGNSTATHDNAVGWMTVHLAIYPASGPTDFPLDAQPGSFTISDAASLTRVVAGRMVNAASASYVLSGIAATVVAGRVVNAVPGAYTISGLDAALLTARLINAQPGVFTITGIDATLAAGGGDFPLDAQPGSFTLTGVAAGAVAGRMVLASPGAFTLTGVNATLVADRVIEAAPGVYVVTGTLAAVVAGRVVAAVPGEYVVTGIATTQLATRALNAQPGAFVITGFTAGLVYTVPGGSTSRNRTMLGVGL